MHQNSRPHVVNELQHIDSQFQAPYMLVLKCINKCKAPNRNIEFEIWI